MASKHAVPVGRRKSREGSTDVDVDVETAGRVAAAQQRPRPRHIAPPEEAKEIAVGGCVNLVKKAPLTSTAMCVATCQADPDWAAVGCSDGNVAMYSFSAQQFLSTLTDRGGQVKAATCVDFLQLPQRSQDTPLLAAAHSSGVVNLWDVQNNTTVASFTDPEAPALLTVACDGHSSRMVTGSADAQLRVYDIQQQKQISVLKKSDRRSVCDGHTQRIFCVKFHPQDKRLLISGGWDTTIQFWDLRVENSVRHISGPLVTGGALAFKANGRSFAAGSFNVKMPLQEFDFKSGKLISSYPHLRGKSRLYTCQYITGDEQSILVCGGNEKNMLRLVDSAAGTGKALGSVSNLEKSVYDVAHTPAKRVVPDDGAYQEASSRWLGHIAMCSGEDLYVLSHDIH